MTDIKRMAREIKALEKNINMTIDALKRVHRAKNFDIEIEILVMDGKVVLKTELDLIFSD